MQRCVSPAARTARACSLLLLAIGLTACANQLSASYEAKAMDRVTAINAQVLTQFDRLLSSPLVCRPRLVASEPFKATYGDIEVQLRVHRMAEEIRPANAESATVASLYLQSWQYHRLSHQLWAVRRNEAEQTLNDLKAELRKSADPSADKATPEEGMRLAQQRLAMLEGRKLPGPADAAFEAEQVKYAATVCETVSAGTQEPDPRPRNAPAALVHLHTGYLGDKALTDMRNRYVRFGRAALVIEEARRVIADEQKTQ
ncbi:hypothetical protein EXV95_18785 [Acidovorax sp. JMULE5]|uniref:hypothetical protein n=1 Tax=Acidovorax sp. JMULE5 TaxID=2518343 RepID=UPI0015A38143|nr:hypothetical protein [Acidovorax sp. JMULE5]QLA82503.1 hypothetical protein EXV95_18785 [Acidovorax sp. JMULE5]